jgi:NADH:ubiquinone oxidoreductase subunit
MSLSIYFRTWWRGRFVGEDIQGNKYFEGKKMMRYGKLRRWVIYNGMDGCIIQTMSRQNRGTLTLGKKRIYPI